jgi:hypothetical protein
MQEPGSPGSRLWGEVSPPLRIVRTAVLFLVLLVLFAVSLTAVYALPQAAILVNLGRSAAQLQREGLYPRPMLDARSYTIDNFTDAIMLDTAVDTSGRGPFFAAMATPHGGSDAPDGPISALAEAATGRRSNPLQYAYYWHGYMVVLRPLLLAFDLGRIRYLNLVALGVLTMLVLHAARRDLGVKASGALALALLLGGFYLVPFCMQFSTMTYLMLASCLAVLALGRSGRLAGLDIELFFSIGALAAFFDLLSTPLMTLGLPLALVLAAGTHPKAAPGFGRGVLFALKVGSAWVVGYVASWIAKWVLGTLVTQTNVFQMAFSQILFRTGLERGPQRVGEALLKNVTNLLPTLRTSDLAGGVAAGAVVLGLAGLLGVATLGWAMWRHGTGRAGIARAAAVLIVVPLPYVWMVAANNHSAIHNWFTYRMQVFSVFAVVYFVASCIDFPALREALARRRRRPDATALGGAS